ncbi:hypothetical protein ACHAXT_004246 [Thalassiosira profunda]
MTTVSQPSTWTEALEMIENNNPHIRKLVLSSTGEVGGKVELVSEPDIASFDLHFPTTPHPCAEYFAEYLALLGDAIGKNTHLQVLSLWLEGAAPDITDSFLEGVKRNASIRVLDLTGSNLSDEAVCGILISLGEGSNNLAQSLRNIAHFVFRARNLEGICAFVSVVRRCTNLEELDISHGDDAGDIDSGFLLFHEIVEAIRYPRLLTRIRTPPIGRAGFESLVPLLQDADSNLRKLNLDINAVDVDAEWVATVLAKST